MSKLSKKASSQRLRDDKRLEVLYSLEPELRHLSGLLSILTLLGETSDAVDPIALSSLGQAAQESFGAIEESWRKLLTEARQE